MAIDNFGSRLVVLLVEGDLEMSSEDQEKQLSARRHRWLKAVHKQRKVDNYMITILDFGCQFVRYADTVWELFDDDDETLREFDGRVFVVRFDRS